MIRNKKDIKAASYTAGVFVIAAAVLLALLLLLSLLGLFHPRQIRITLYTGGKSKFYDGTPLQGDAPTVRYGQLLEGHTLQLRELPEYTDVGTYSNEPVYVILDASGADVTAQYDIIHDFGKINIFPQGFLLTAMGKSKVYDGEPLTADELILSGGSLAPGHSLICDGFNSILQPGTVQIQPVYRIVSEDGKDVTDQYSIHEDFGTLEILPIELTVSTASASKVYDGKSLAATDWSLVAGSLLEGHTIEMKVSASLSDVGTIANEGVARVVDESGKDVTNLYRFNYQFGTLQVHGLCLYITTMSAQKIYDGEPLTCPDWKLTGGTLPTGAVMTLAESAVVDTIGTVDNAMRFVVTDANGADITYRYQFILDYGTLSVQPKAITIRTDSAQKVYDGTPLSCGGFSLVNGSLCDGDYIELSCTSITEVGYSENYVLDCTVYHVAEDGSISDVTNCYRISYDFGTLKITDK